MAHSYNVRSTSNKTAQVEDIWLEPPEDPGAARTRRILRAQLVDNAHSEVARVKATLHHQKRHTSKEPWEDVEAFNLVHLKSGQEVRLGLNAAQTYQLYQELHRLYALTADGIPKDDGGLVVAKEGEAVLVGGRARDVISEMLTEASDDFWEALSKLHPNLFRAVALTKLHELREQAVQRFEQHLEAGDWIEDDWQDFFESNTWIFGYGLSYQFLGTVETQPHYMGKRLAGQGEQRGDFLTASKAEHSFTVLVEIEKPSTSLIAEKPYRQRAHIICGHLAGGVAQLQSNCRNWEMYGTRDDENRERLDPEQIHTVSPKGILIIGTTAQLDSVAKRTSFELFRRNVRNPEIITFDELLERAKHLLLNEEKNIPSGDDP